MNHVSGATTTESSNPASADLDRLTTAEFVALVNREDAGVAAAVAAAAPAITAAIDRIAAALDSGGRLVYVGAGTSGRLGVLDAAECPPTFSAAPGQVVGIIAGGPRALTEAVEGAEDSASDGAADLDAAGVGPRDVVVGITASGTTPYVLGALARARELGAGTVGFSCNADSPVAAAADIAITVVVGPEVLSGSTRMKAGTATKMVLNLLSTGAMVRLGKTYGNLMVDLMATNAKLAARARRIVGSVTGLGEAEAQALLDGCDGDLKAAIVSHVRGIGGGEARDRLDAAGGRLRKALEAD
jgi:N-acetylmuramic acid 6-phosphate etherase